jgi:hypothetical protein
MTSMRGSEAAFNAYSRGVRQFRNRDDQGRSSTGVIAVPGYGELASILSGIDPDGHSRHSGLATRIRT